MNDHLSSRVRFVLCLCLSAGIALALAPAASAAPCLGPNNGTGTVTLPVPGCPYLSPSQVHLLINGLPPGTTLQLGAQHARFFCNGQPGPCTRRKSAATDGVSKALTTGEIEEFSSDVILTITGTGALAGFSRTLTVPANVETETGPRNLGASVQTFWNRMNRLQGSITGDADFGSLQIVAGNDFGLNSPGSTTLTRLTNGSYRVNSYFDVAYRISFVGEGRLKGYGGTTEGTVRMSVPTE